MSNKGRVHSMPLCWFFNPLTSPCAYKELDYLGRNGRALFNFSFIVVCTLSILGRRMQACTHLTLDHKVIPQFSLSAFQFGVCIIDGGWGRVTLACYPHRVPSNFLHCGYISLYLQYNPNKVTIKHGNIT